MSSVFDNLSKEKSIKLDDDYINLKIVLPDEREIMIAADKNGLNIQFLHPESKTFREEIYCDY